MSVCMCSITSREPACIRTSIITGQQYYTCRCWGVEQLLRWRFRLQMHYFLSRSNSTGRPRSDRRFDTIWTPLEFRFTFTRNSRALCVRARALLHFERCTCTQFDFFSPYFSWSFAQHSLAHWKWVIHRKKSVQMFRNIFLLFFRST